MVFAIVYLGGMAGDRPLKTLLAALLGLFLERRIDANSGVYRFTGDSIHLADGIQFVVLVLGLFSVSEILLLLVEDPSRPGSGESHRTHAVQLQGGRQRIAGQPALRSARFRHGRTARRRRDPGKRGGLYDREEAGRCQGRVRQGRHARPGRSRDRHRRLHLRRHGADADPRRARLGYHCGDDRRPDPVQHHSRPAAVPAATGQSSGA